MYDTRGRLLVTAPATVAAALLALPSLAPSPARAANGYTLTTLANVLPSNAWYGLSGVTIDSHGNLFGAAPADAGPSMGGFWYEIPAGTSTATDIGDFASLGTYNLSSPYRPLAVDAAGNVFGACFYGGYSNYYSGPYGDGGVAALRTGTSSPQTIIQFSGGATGGHPRNGVTIDAQGNLYGTTTIGGSTPGGGGAIWKMSAGTLATQALLYNTFPGQHSFSAPVAVDSHGNVFTTIDSSPGDSTSTRYGAIIGMTPGSHLTSGPDLLNVSFSLTNGSFPQGSLVIDSAGNIFGTTGGGGDSADDGVVYEVVAGTNTITVLDYFNGANGSHPNGLVADQLGNLFGVTPSGGAHGCGTVFEIAAGTHTIVDLADFDGVNGGYPNGGLTIDPYGNLYGTAYATVQNGNRSGGIVFALRRSGGGQVTTDAPEPGTLPLLLPAALATGASLRLRRAIRTKVA